jgi:uncharacterized RDD family membrane protein YckC
VTTQQPREPGILTQAAPALRRAPGGPAARSTVAAPASSGEPASVEPASVEPSSGEPSAEGPASSTTRSSAVEPFPAGPPSADRASPEPPSVDPPAGGDASTRTVSPDPQPAPAEQPPFAGWWRRVMATLLDTWVVATVSFLVNGTFDTSWGVHPSSDSPAFPALHAPTVVRWVMVAILLVLQAYTGSTPGKRAMGVAIVREADGRPLGLLRTVVREIVHVVDAIVCFVGYLRPLWHSRRRTFADSIMASDAVVTRSPGPHRAVEWLRRRGVQLLPGNVATALAGAVSTIAVLALPVVHVAGGGSDVSCQGDPSIHATATGGDVLDQTGAPLGAGSTRPTSSVDEKWLTSPTPRLLEARGSTPGWQSEERLGITRRHRVSDQSTFWWVYGGPVTTLTAVLGPTEPDGSRSAVDDDRSVRLEVDVAAGTATINHGSVRVASVEPGIVGVSFVPNSPIDDDERFGWTAAVEPGTGAISHCGSF